MPEYTPREGNPSGLKSFMEASTPDNLTNAEDQKVEFGPTSSSAPESEELALRF
jgi:hypothetical protein